MARYPAIKRNPLHGCGFSSDVQMNRPDDCGVSPIQFSAAL